MDNGPCTRETSCHWLLLSPCSFLQGAPVVLCPGTIDQRVPFSPHVEHKGASLNQQRTRWNKGAGKHPQTASQTLLWALVGDLIVCQPQPLQPQCAWAWALCQAPHQCLMGEARLLFQTFFGSLTHPTPSVGIDAPCYSDESALIHQQACITGRSPCSCVLGHKPTPSGTLQVNVLRFGFVSTAGTRKMGDASLIPLNLKMELHLLSRAQPSLNGPSIVPSKSPNIQWARTSCSSRFLALNTRGSSQTMSQNARQFNRV